MTETAQVFIDIFDAYDANISKINNIVKNGFYDVAIIMTVSALEVMLTDLLKAYKKFWFSSIAGGYIETIPYTEQIEIRKEIRKYLRSIGAYDDFLRSYYVYQGQIYAEINSIYEVLFNENGRSKLNFQNLNENYGARKTYKLFFNVDLMETLDSNKGESHRKWEELILFVQERHDIIHKGKITSYSRDKIISTLKSLTYMRDQLSKIVIPCYQISPGCYLADYPADKNLLN